MHCITDWWQSCRVWEQEIQPNTASYCSLHHWHFPDAKAVYDLSKWRKEWCLPCVWTRAWTLGSVKTRVLCLGCSPSSLWTRVQPAWDAQTPQVSGTCLTCWRLSHLSPSLMQDHRCYVLQPGFPHVTLIRGSISKRTRAFKMSWRCSHYHLHCLKFPVNYTPSARAARCSWPLLLSELEYSPSAGSAVVTSIPCLSISTV